MKQAQTANFIDFPLTDGAAVEQQCLCKWLQEIDSKRKLLQYTNQLENNESWMSWVNLRLIRWYTKGEKVAENLKIINVLRYFSGTWPKLTGQKLGFLDSGARDWPAEPMETIEKMQKGLVNSC